MFLPSGKAIREAIKGLLETELDEPARLAVAYWGRGAATALRGPCRIVCNLASGACNPAEVRKMMAHELWIVRQHDNLHAKVVVTSAGAVVSSANFSSNGLGLEGADAAGLEEAGFKIPANSQDHQATATWFEDIWGASRRIEEKDLLKAQEMWDQRRRQSQGSNESRVYTADQTAPPEVSVGALLQDSIFTENRLRSTNLDVLNLLEAALPHVTYRPSLGKIATWACHLILLRAGHQLEYGPSRNGELGGRATEDWIVCRIKSYIPEVMTSLAAIANAPGLGRGVRHWAEEVLRSPPWEH